MSHFFKQLTNILGHNMLKLALAITLMILLNACDSSTKTVTNPFTVGSNEQDTYSGPPPETLDVKDFQDNLWTTLKADNRCGQCHDNDGGQTAFADETDVNIAYNNILSLINKENPSNSRLVTIFDDGHNCWEQFDSVCADSIESMISSWTGSSDSNIARVIQMTAPVNKDPGNSKTFPNTSDNFAATVHPLLIDNCIACHYEEGLSQQQRPFFANPDTDSAFEAVKPKMNIDFPENSLLVQRILGLHGCWSDNCNDDATEMLQAIEAFADAIVATEINPALITSKALTLLDGIVASGGNRQEASQIAIWEFKAGTGSTAFDTSGIEPINLSLTGNVTWLGAYGLDFSGGKAQADTQTSKRLYDAISASGEFSLEAWIIPANVTQEDANIIGYDVGSNQKNFSLSQTLYNYNFFNRTDLSEADGVPVLSTRDEGEILQSSLQHVVLTYGIVSGRKIYVNGVKMGISDPTPGSTSIASWDPSYAFTLGQNANNGQTWQGKLRMVSIHNRELTNDQILENYEAGVGQKYFLLFSIAEQPGIPADSYIRFEVSQFDSFSYLFEKPTFINLNADWVPGGFTIKNLRLGINGKEAVAGQSYANMETTINSSYNAADGQALSSLGAVIALEKGSDDEFFLTFEVLGSNTHVFDDPAPLPPAIPDDADPVSDIGVRTFDEINATIAKITGIAVTNTEVTTVFNQYRQQLPTVENIDAFLSSHQMAIAQLALTSCSERVEADRLLPTGNSSRLFTHIDFSATASSAFDTAEKRAFAIDPILNAVLSLNLASQPDPAEIFSLLGSTDIQTLQTDSGSYDYQSLITQMNTINTSDRTIQIVKAVCAAVVGSAAMLIQ